MDTNAKEDWLWKGRRVLVFRKDDQALPCGFEEMSNLRSPGDTLEEALQQHIDSELITYPSDYVSLTTEGFLITDKVISDFR